MSGNYLEIYDLASNALANPSLYEIKAVKQDHPNLRRRWFTTENCDADLFVWENNSDNTVACFRFFFDRHADEKIIEWKTGKGFCCGRVDGGESRSHFKASPLLIWTDDIDLRIALDFFRYYSAELDENLREFIEQRFGERLLKAS